MVHASHWKVRVEKKKKKKKDTGHVLLLFVSWTKIFVLCHKSLFAQQDESPFHSGPVTFLLKLHKYDARILHYEISKSGP